jgi:hypothetical protein
LDIQIPGKFENQTYFCPVFEWSDRTSHNHFFINEKNTNIKKPTRQALPFKNQTGNRMIKIKGLHIRKTNNIT